jgi:hypothetical protein
MKPIALIASAVLVALPAQAAWTPYGPTPYRGFADSPFAAVGFGSFFLETFEDHLFDAPGVSASAGGVTSVFFGPSIHDSVDADDGAIDGSGLQGDDFFSFRGASGITFSFSAAALGALPSHAGLVWTDGGAGASVSFSVFGAGGQLLYTTTQPGMADGSNNGETAEDRFFGASDPAGISAIFVSNSSGGIEIDHLQYGIAAVPEPQAWALMAAGLLLLRLRSGRPHP